MPKSQGSLASNANYMHGLNRSGNSVDLVFEKLGGMFMVLETSTNEVGGGYRASVWLLSRSQRLEMISQHELEL